MPKFAWVALGMVVSGAGGVAGAWVFFASIGFGDPVSPENFKLMVGSGGVLAAMVGGFGSLRRGRPGERQSMLRAWLALAVGFLIAFAITPGGTLAIFHPLFIIILVFSVWPFALLGGLSLLALVWTGLWIAGVDRAVVAADGRVDEGRATP